MQQQYVDVVWRPQAGSQVAFLSCPIFETLYEGTRGGGKTDCLLMDFAKECGRGYGSAWRGILFRKTYKQLGDVIAKSKKWFPRIFGKNCSFNNTDSTWNWRTGEMLLLRHFNRDDDYENYHGHEYPWLGLEELTNWAVPTVLTKMISTVRSPHPGLPMRVRATTNPYGPGHGWVKRRYDLHKAIRDRRIQRNLVDEDGNSMPDRMSIHSDIRENKILLNADPMYMDKLRASCRSEAERKAWLEGSWDIVAGGMFDDLWQTPIHNLLPFDVPSSWKVKPAMDWGSTHPFSLGWWGVSDGSDFRTRAGLVRSTVRGDIFRLREWYGCKENEVNVGLKMSAGQVAKGMIERQLLWKLHERTVKGIADGAIIQIANGRSVQREMEDPIRLDNGKEYPGIKWKLSDKSSGSRILGWQAIRQYLENAVPPKSGNPREKPGLFVVGPYCGEFLRTVLSLPRDPDNMDDVDSDAEDHCGDETRYFVYEQPKATGMASYAY